eukprot:Awhi_evm1s6030
MITNIIFIIVVVVYNRWNGAVSIFISFFLVRFPSYTTIIFVISWRIAGFGRMTMFIFLARCVAST